MKKRKRKKVSNIVLIAAVTAVIGYAINATIVQIITGVELSPTLTTAWFSFWGVEIIALAAIKTTKVKHPPSEENPPDDEITE